MSPRGTDEFPEQTAVRPDQGRAPAGGASEVHRVSLERIHVYEIRSTAEGDGPVREHRAVVAAGGGALLVGSEVRLVVLDPASCGGPVVLPRVVADHGAARRIAADSVAAPLDFGLISRDGGKLFWCAAPFVPGRRLAALLAEAGTLPDPLSEALAVSLAGALAAVHATGLCAVGLDAERVVVREDGSAAILDPGLGPVWTAAARATSADGGPGRAGLEPELLADATAVSPAVDLYALGALLFRCMAGVEHAAAGGADDAAARRPNAHRPSASIFLSEVVHDLLA